MKLFHRVFEEKNIGVTIDWTQKWSEFKYAFVIGKLYYRKSLIDQKSTKSLFYQQMDESTDPVKVLTIQKMHVCSRKASVVLINEIIQGLGGCSCFWHNGNK